MIVWQLSIDTSYRCIAVIDDDDEPARCLQSDDRRMTLGATLLGGGYCSVSLYVT